MAYLQSVEEEGSEGFVEDLPPNFALVPTHPNDLLILDEALHGPDSKH